MPQNNISIAPSRFPSVSAGKYNIKVESVNDLLSTTSKIDFVVSGFMHHVPESEILSVYPPRAGLGNYAGSFPIVQFKRSSLPWDFMNQDADGERSPYLFIALFEEDEIDLDGKLMDDKKVQLQKANTTKLDPCYEKNKEFSYLKVPPSALFSLPDGKEMKHLAHVRIQQEKENVLPHLSCETAIVISKRMVFPNKKYVAFVCSYIGENSGKFRLSGTKKEHEANYLIVLHQWRFESFCNDSYQYNQTKFNGLSTVDHIKARKSKYPILQGEEELSHYLNKGEKQFAPIIEKLKKGGQEKAEVLSILKYEGKTLKGMIQELKFSEINYNLPTKSANSAVNDMIGLGKIPLLHNLKSGGKMISWYQGPFVRSNYKVVFKELSNTPEAGFDLGDVIPDHSEKLIFYNGQTKMLDMGYAAAWQLGRILVMNNTKVLQEIKKWKDQLKLNELMSYQNEEYSPLNLALDYSVRQLPELIKSFLINLVKLIDFPYYYLFPHQSILPEESVKYFKLDNSWMISMLFGVFSIGNAFSLNEFKSYVLNNSSFADYFDFKQDYFGLLIHSEVIVNWPQLSIEVDDHSDFRYATDLTPSVRLLMTTKSFSKISLFMKNENAHFAIDFPNDHDPGKVLKTDGLLGFAKEGNNVNYTVSGFDKNISKKRMPFDLLFRQPKTIFNIT